MQAVFAISVNSRDAVDQMVNGHHWEVFWMDPATVQEAVFTGRAPES